MSALEHQDRHAEAREAYGRAADIEVGTNSGGGSYVNLALNLHGDGRTAEALDLLERNLVRYGTADAHGIYAQLLRAAGRLPDGGRTSNSDGSRNRSCPIGPPYSGRSGMDRICAERPFCCGPNKDSETRFNSSDTRRL